VQGYAQLVDGDGDKFGGLTVRTVGASADGIGTVSPFELRSGRPPVGPDEVVVDVGSARRADLTVGDRVTVLLTGPARTFTLVGTVGFGRLDAVAGSTYTLFELPTAQAVLGRAGQVDEVLVSAAPGVSPDELVGRVGAALGDGISVESSAVRAAQRARDARAQLAIVDRALLSFALIALVVGGFIIVNTFTIVVAQRTRELALLRALGASQRQVRRSVLIEAAATGFVASVVGAAAGVGLAAGLRRLVEAFGLEIPGSGVQVEMGSLIVPVVAGTLLTAVAAYLPARRAGRTRPLAAMRDMASPARSSRRRYFVGAVLGVIGLVGGILGVPLLLVAAALLAPAVVPTLARVLGWPVARFGGRPGKLGNENAVRNPRRTASTASALMIGLALVVGVTVVGESALRSFSSALDDAVKADFAVYSHSVELDPEVADRLRERPELGVVSEMRMGNFELAGLQGVQSLTAIDAATIEQTFDLGYSDGALSRLADGGVLVSETRAAEHGWEVGDVLPMGFARTGVQQIRIEGTYAEDALEDQGFLLSLRDYEANYTDQRNVRVLVTAASGVSAEEARAAIEQVTSAFPNVRVNDRAGYVAEIKSALDVVLALVAILLGLAVIIAVLGIVNTMALSIVERTRELGLLRAVGMSRRQLRAMIRWESMTIALIGGVLGVAVGMQVGATISSSLGDVIASVTFPWARLALFLVFAVVAGAAAAALPARRAARLDVLAAISHD
jgi:putative ABC transport system permease protein